MDLSKLLSDEEVTKDAELGNDIESLLGDTNIEDVEMENPIKPEEVVEEKPEPVIAETKVEEKTETLEPQENVTVKSKTEEKAETAKETSKPKKEKEPEFIDTIGIQMPSEDPFLKDLQTYTWAEDPISNQVKIYRIETDKMYEVRTRYRYLSPKLIMDSFGISEDNIKGFAEFGGSFSFTTTLPKSGVRIVVNETITGYYPAFVMIIDGDNVETIKLKHTAKYITSIIDKLVALEDRA